ncbi:MAG: hypothetical protein R3F56_08655 [Planctomycetota bacterium]
MVAHLPAEGARVHLNEPLAIAFSDDVDLATVTPSSVRFTRTDEDGGLHDEAPGGTFRVRAPTPSIGGRAVLEFEPALPVAGGSDGSLHHLGLRPGQAYTLTVPGLAGGEASLLLGASGSALATTFTLHFSTVSGDRASDLFRDPAPGGPRVVGVSATRAADGTVATGALGEAVEVRIRFDQALSPAATNLPGWRVGDFAHVDRRSVEPERKGRVFLEYDDPEFGPSLWLPATVQVEDNDAAGCTLVLVPVGLLPNRASVRVVVEPTLTDIAGESNVGEPDYDRVVARLQTETAEAPRFDALVADFADPDHVDFDAVFLEPMAEVGEGCVRAAAVFPGSDVDRDYAPRAFDVLLNTDFTQITPVSGASFDVLGGVFEFRNVTIPAGVHVRASGSKPMVWRVTGDFVVEGELTVSGGDGQPAQDAYNRGLSPGGVAGCAGGRGGHGSPSYFESDREGEAGFGAFQVPGGGGAGGANRCIRNDCARSGGGGGGSFATAGDPHHVLAWLGDRRLPRVAGGRGAPLCASTMGEDAQAAAGPVAFLDARPDDDFWGSAVDLRRGLRIAGELLSPRGGSGGGGGGDYGACPPNQFYVADRRGGGGGGGGGALIVQALGRVVIRAGGVIRANGGHGGGGATGGGNAYAGGGGGGAGGMVVLMSASGIHIAAHGAPYAEANLESNADGACSFAVEADGGVGLSSGWAGGRIADKYPSRGGAASASQWDLSAAGGFGGSGLVQLMVPAGDNAPIAAGGDGTDTRLDDRVFFYEDDAHLARGLAADEDGGAQRYALSGGRKIRYLGWRGLVDADGVGRNDRGEAVALPHDGHGEGDIRPAPILLPVPYGPVSRLRSRWIDTGSTARRGDAGGSDPGPRAMAPQRDPRDPEDPFTNLMPGPTWMFAGTFDASEQPTGYVRYRQAASGVERQVDAVLASALPVATLATTIWRGRPAYRVELRQPLPAPAPNRYVGYLAELQAGLGEPLGAYRIVEHQADVMVLAADDVLPDRPVARVQVRADFLIFDGDPFGGWHREGDRHVPNANLRVGFAFHVDPARPDWRGGEDVRRLPSEPDRFLLGLDRGRPDLVRAVRALGKAAAATEGATAVQYDLLFNIAFREAAPHVGRASAAAGRPRLRRLVLPGQF